jgi:hypothetical protein
VSALADVLVAQQAVTLRAAEVPLPDELRDLPTQSAARLAALRRVGAGSAGGKAPERGDLEATLRSAIAAAYAAVQKLDDEQTLRVVSQVMAGNGQSLALLRLSMNRPPVPDAFETGKAP